VVVLHGSLTFYYYLCKKIERYNMTNEELMRRACRLSEESVKKGGGPFGAVIAKNGVIVAEASNSVTTRQ
jgi:tRNA(Arg) A34 adenosine deaminase TadA